MLEELARARKNKAMIQFSSAEPTFQSATEGSSTELDTVAKTCWQSTYQQAVKLLEVRILSANCTCWKLCLKDRTVTFFEMQNSMMLAAKSSLFGALGKSFKISLLYISSLHDHATRWENLTCSMKENP